MSRVKINLPPNTIFTADYTVKISDINYGGHLGNDSILSIAQESRMQLFRHLGYKDEVSIEENIGLIMADTAIVFKSESFYGDYLSILMGANNFSKVSFDLYYQIINRKNTKEIARIKTGMVCFDYKNKSIAPVPLKLKELLSKAQ